MTKEQIREIEKDCQAIRKLMNEAKEIQLRVEKIYQEIKEEKEEIKEEIKEETKILKNEYKLNYDGYTIINKELNNIIDYSFTKGYEHVTIRRYFADTLEFISENKYQGYLYKNSLKTYNSLKEMKEI